MNILLVEDNDVDAQILKRALKKAGMTGDFVHVRDGHEALQVLREQRQVRCPHHPFLVLLDINMPGMNGHEFLASLRQDPQIAAVRVIVLSTSCNPSDVTQAYDRFASGYLVKPDNSAELADTLGAISNFWDSLTHPPPTAPAPRVS